MSRKNWHKNDFLVQIKSVGDLHKTSVNWKSKPGGRVKAVNQLVNQNYVSLVVVNLFSLVADLTDIPYTTAIIVLY